MVTIYEKDTGTQLSVHPVDARALVNGGGYQWTPIVQEAPEVAEVVEEVETSMPTKRGRKGKP